MYEYLGPLQGLAFGLILIIFNRKISQLIKKAFEKLPKYENGVKALNIKFDIQPFYVTILGLIFILIAIAGFVEIQNSGPL